LGSNEDLYGRKLSVIPAVKLRDQQTLSSLHALTEQLHHDVAATRNWAKQHYPWLVPPGSHQSESRAGIWPEQARTVVAAQ
jgi:hypothetical protein